MAQKHPEPGSDLPVKFQAQFKSLLRLYETKKYKKGLKIANTILKAHPKHGETIAIKGLLVNCMAENNAAQKAEAYALAREGLKLHFRSHICWHVLGLIYRSDRNYEEAIKCYKNALRHDPENGQILRDLSLLQTHSRDLKGLLVTRKKLLVQKPNRSEFWLTFVMVYHLLNQPNKALEVLQSYQSSVEVPKPTDDWEKRFQWNELAMYKNLLLQDAGKYAEAAQQLLDDDGFVLDKTGSLEARAHCWLKAGDERAKKAYHDLLELNAEHYDYIKGYISSLNISEQAADFAQQIEQVFNQLEQEFPRSTAVKRLVLSLLPAGDSFKAKLSPYIKPWLTKGVPSLFGSLKDLYTNKEKVNIIADVISSYVTSLRQTGKFPDAIDEEPEAPSTLVWALYFLAQHKLALGEFKEAFDAVEEAIAHTPTIIELYVVKAKIYKRANAFKEAAYWMDFARDLDLADRWLNTKSAKYFLLADDVPKADSTIGLFTSKDCDPQTALFDMQCMWFEQEAGESYMRQKRYAPALRKLTSIYQHFQDIDADQFDFHGYCARKMTWNAYVSMLRMEDALYSRSKCYNACKAIVESWIGLYDTPGKESDSQFEEKLAGMDEKEKRIAIKKRKRDQARREQEDAQRNLEKQKEDQKNRKKGRRTEDDPEGEKLTKDKEPLVEATTYVKVLQKHSRQQIGTHLVAFEVNLRKKKVLAALRDVKRAKAIDANHPQVHVNAIRLLNFVKERPLAGVVKDVFDAETAELGNIDNLLSINDEFLAKNNASLPHRVAAAKVIKLIQPGSDRIEPLLTDLSGTGVTLENCRAALAELSNDGKIAAYKAKCHELFPYATVFAPEGEASQ